MEQGKFVLKQESHLKKGIKSIFACLIEDVTGGTEESKNAQELIANNKKIDNVDFDGNYPYLKEAGYLVGKSDHTYIISPVSESNKFSEGYVNCTGVVVSGKDKNTGRYISFLTHQNPRYFLSSLQPEFTGDLRTRLQEIKERCEEGTIDAIAFGGMYDDLDAENIISQKYNESVDLITNEVKASLGFNPTVVNGPKINNLFGRIGKDNFYFDNENRRAYFVRPKVNNT